MFESLVPFNLILSALILLVFQQDRNATFVFFVFFIFCMGYLIELLGVQTQLIFGAYKYESSLGIKVFEVPVIIGLNWLILLYGCGVIANMIKAHLLIRILLASALMVGIDVLIEPVAIRHKFWSWEGHLIPLKNYIGWFWVSAIFITVFYTLEFKKNNPVAAGMYVIQFSFFLAHNLTY